MLDPKLLKMCTDKGERVIELEQQVQQAKVDYHFAIRRLHLAGGSYREIAAALGLSHQRVNQIVEADSRSWLRRWLRPAPKERRLACSFCGKSSQAVERLVAGPNVHICDACIDGAQEVFRTGAKAKKPGSLALMDDGAKRRCSFCGRKSGKGRRIVGAARDHICDECLALAERIATQEPA